MTGAKEVVALGAKWRGAPNPSPSSLPIRYKAIAGAAASVVLLLVRWLSVEGELNWKRILATA